MRKWSEVAESAGYKALPAAEQDAARRQYFDQVVAPRVPNKAEVNAAWQQFERDSRVAKVDLPPGVAPSQAGAGRGSVNPELAPPAAPPRPRNPLRAVQPYGAGGDIAVAAPLPEGEAAEQTLRVALGDEAGRLRDTFFTGVDQARAGLRMVEGGLLASGVQARHRNLREAEAAGDTATAQRLRAQMPGRQQRLGESLAAAAEAQGDAQRGAAMTTTPAMREMLEAQTFGDAWQAFKKAPVEIISGITAQSMPVMLPALLVAATTGPVAGALAMGASSGAVEAGGALAEFAQKSGIDPTDARALTEFYNDPDVLREGLSRAAVRAGIIGAADTVAGGLAGRTLAPAMRSGVARQAVNLPAQMTTQAALGGGGEAGAQVAESGQIDAPGQVLAEAVGEFGGAPAEVLAFGRNARALRQPPEPPPPSAEQIARSKGFLVSLGDERAKPSAVRQRALSTFQELGSYYGLPEGAAKKASQATDGMPADEVPGFLARYAQALQRRGLFRRPLDEEALQAFSPPPEPDPAAHATGGAIEAGLERRLAESLGVAEREAPAAPAAEPTPVDLAAHDAATSPANDRPEPTKAQKDAGNYAKGHIKVGGLDISIENPQGSTRSGTSPDGTAWQNTMASHYGYVRGSTGKDGDHVDVFVKPGTPEDYRGPVYVVDQVNPGGRFDEHKALLGFGSIEEARQGYLSNYDADWQGLGAITEMPLEAFRSWVKDGKKRRPVGETARKEDEDVSAPVPTGVVAGGRSDGGGAVDAGSLVDSGRAVADPGRDRADARGAVAGPAEGAVARDGRIGDDAALTAQEPQTRDIQDAPPQRTRTQAQAPADQARAAVEGDAARSEGPADAGGPAVQAARVIARAGRTPNAATPIELRTNPDGTVTPFMDGQAMLDYDSGEPIVLPSGVSDLDAKKAIRAAGAVSSRTNFFPPASQPKAQSAPQAAPAQAQASQPEPEGQPGDGVRLSLAADQTGFAEKVDAVLDGSMPESASVQVSPALDVLTTLGMRPLPVSTTGDRLAKMHFDHGLTRADLKKLPDLLTAPVMVFDSATRPGSLVAVLDLWKNGAPVVAAIEPNVELKRVQVNLLASAYPKDRVAQLGAWFKDGRLKYADKSKTRAWATNGGVQFPWLVQLSRGSNGKVLGPGDVVKGKGRLSLRDDLPVRLPDAIIGQPLSAATKHPDYQAAKAGDVQAAYRLARDLVTDDMVAAVRAQIGEGESFIVPVVAEEASGRNKIPHAVAAVLADRLGLRVTGDIIQSSRPNRTALSGISRIFASPEFDGPVQRGARYVLADDTLTQGGTFAALGSHIEQGGGRVAAVVALTGKQYSAKLALSPQTRTQLYERFADVEPAFRAATGRGLDTLTESEARYLVTHRSPDAIRARILAQGRADGSHRASAADLVRDLSSRGNAQYEAASAAYQRTKEGSNTATLRAALAADLGRSAVEALEQAGLLRITDHPPAGVPADAAGRAVDGRMELYAANIPEGSLSVAYHEALHATLRGMVGDAAYDALMARMVAFDRQAQGDLKSSAMGRFFAEGAQRIPSDTAVNARGEELAAYAVEQYQRDREAMSAPVRRWVEDFLAAIRAGLARALRAAGIAPGVQARLLADPATLRRLAIQGLKAKARGQIDSAASPVLASRTEDVAERNALTALSETDDLFRLPKSEATTIEAIAAENDPGIVVKKRNIPGEPRWDIIMPNGKTARIMVRKPNPYGGSTYGFDYADGEMSSVLTERPGDNPEAVDPETEDVWLDVSLLSSGDDGRKVYNIAATFAHNTGRIFIGDPAGLSNEAMRRRPEQMLSSALKFGTTRHLAPHPRQITGDAKLGIPPLKWVYGDDLGNIRRLIDLNLKALDTAGDAPDISFDPQSAAFLDSDAGVLSREDLGLLAASGAGSKALAGGSTLARAAVLRALLRQESQAVGGADRGGDGLLARLVRLGSVHPDSVRGVFYSRAQSGVAPPAAPPASAAAPVAAPAAAPAAAAVPAEGVVRGRQRELQDKFNRFTVVRDWAKKQGISLTPESDVRAFEERMHGRMATRMEDFREKRVKPLVQKIQAAGFTMEQVAEFLHAQHAEERNAQIEKVSPGNTAGSGMTTADAKKLLAAADPKLAALANEFRAITSDTKDILLKAGIISQEMVDAWEKAYKHYVPLKGGPDEGTQAGTGSGLSVNGRQRRALGHAERDERIIENILRDHERAITLAEKNTVGHSLLAFVAELGNDAIATVGQPEKRKVLRDSTSFEVVGRNGTVVGAFDSQAAANRFIVSQARSGLTVRKVTGDPQVTYMAAPMLAENEVQVYLKGHAVRIQLNDPILARAYKNLGAEHLNRLMAVNRSVNVFLSKAYTGYNPEFLFVNVLRDLTTGLINITGKYGAGMAADALARYPKAMGTLLRYAFTGKSTPSIDAYRASGGSTGAAWVGDIERIGADIKAAYEEYQGVLALVSQGRGLAAARVAAKKLLNLLVGWIEKLNQAGENAMRLAVFDAVRNTQGQTVNDAASAAKNVTVNFNRKGEMGPVLGALYLFYNPAVQGTAAMMEALFKGQHKAQAWAMTAGLGAAAYTLATLQFGGDEDDDAWNNIPDHVKERSLIIRTGEKTYLTLPIPYGYGFFYALGNSLFDLQKGRDPDKVALNVASNLVGNFLPMNPIGGDELDSRGAVELVPGMFGGELMRAGARVLVNRSGLGGEIVPDSKFDEGKPDSTRMWRTTKGSVYDRLAGGLNAATGGTKTQAGVIDVSPETLKFWVNTVTGGAGRFASDTIGMTLNFTVEGVTPEVNEIPIARKFLREESVRDVRARYWEAVREADEAAKDLSRAGRGGDAEGMQQASQKAALVEFAKLAQKQNELIKARRDHADSILADESRTLAERRAMVAEMEARERRHYENLLKAYDMTKEADKRRATERRERSQAAGR